MQDERTYELFKKIEKWMDNKPEKKSKEEDAIYNLVVDKIYEIKGRDFSNIKLNYDFYLNLHKELFEDIYPDKAGKVRNYNIIKSEPTLKGASVEYEDYNFLKEDGKRALDNIEKNINSIKNPNDKKEYLLKETIKIWKSHYFLEGNTRTTALFIDILGNKNGIPLNLLREDIRKFRDSLVKTVAKNNEKDIRKYFFKENKKIQIKKKMKKKEENQR